MNKRDVDKPVALLVIPDPEPAGGGAADLRAATIAIATTYVLVCIFDVDSPLGE